MSDTATAELEHTDWALVMLALARSESDDDASEPGQECYGNVLDELKDQVTVTSLDLVELQHEMEEHP